MQQAQSSSLLLPVDAGTNRVTAGVPSLSPFVRALCDYRGAQMIKTRALTAEAEQKKAHAANPDSRPSQKPEAQLGRVMHSRDIIVRLNKLNSNLLFERSTAVPDKMGVYTVQDGEKRFLFGFEFGYSPEFSILSDEGDVRLRGWRKVLANLIRSRMITLPAAESAFNILSGPESRNWHMLVQ